MKNRTSVKENLNSTKNLPLRFYIRRRNVTSIYFCLTLHLSFSEIWAAHLLYGRTNEGIVKSRGRHIDSLARLREERRSDKIVISATRRIIIRISPREECPRYLDTFNGASFQPLIWPRLTQAFTQSRSHPHR